MGEGVDLRGRLVAADGFDAREAHGEAAGVAVARLDRVEGDFEHDLRDHFAVTAVLGDGRRGEMFGQLFDLRISQTGIRFANGQQLPRPLVPHRESVVAQHVAAFAVPLLGAHHDHIERGQFLFVFQPGLPAPARRVKARAVLDHQPFVAAGARRFKGRLDVLGGGHAMDRRDFQARRQGERLKREAALGERALEQRRAIEEEQIEGLEDDGDVARAAKEIVLGLAPEALLQIEEREPAALVEREDFAIENDFAGVAASGAGEIGELSGDLPQVPGENLRPPLSEMHLGADAVELVFGPRPRRMARRDALPDRFRRRLRAGQHHLDRAE